MSGAASGPGAARAGRRASGRDFTGHEGREPALIDSLEVADRERARLAERERCAAGRPDPGREEAGIGVDLLVEPVEEAALYRHEIARLVFAEELRDRVAAVELVDSGADA